MKFQILILTIASFLSGCAAIPMAGTGLDRQAKSFQSYEQLSNIYVYRESGISGGGVTWSLKLDGQLVGAIRSGKFMLLVVPSGLHTLSSQGDYGAAWGGEKAVTLNTQPRGKYFIYQDHYSRIWGLENFLHEVDETEGRKGVLGTDLVLTTQSIQDIGRAKFASPETISPPSPILGNQGKYMSPFTAAGGVAVWAQGSLEVKDQGSDIAANIGGAAGRELANKALDFVPFGLGGLFGQKLGESTARAATSKAIEPELPTESVIKASSDISFDSPDALALYLYTKHSSSPGYSKILALTQRIYPELRKAYFTALEKASAPSK